jgi:hypothetical protein
MITSAGPQPVHVAITRRVKPGCEGEFQAALREFFTASFTHSGVNGASMLVPSPGAISTDYGILRTFANEQERDAFYSSPLFEAWKARVAPLTEGEPEHRQLHGLEAWFRSTERPNPPQWKMAIATYLGVVPAIMFLSKTLGRVLATWNWNFVLSNLVFNAFVVALLTWVVMPLITRALHRWLNSK